MPVERLLDHIHNEFSLAAVENGAAVLVAVGGASVGLPIDCRFFARPNEAVRSASSLALVGMLALPVVPFGSRAGPVAAAGRIGRVLTRWLSAELRLLDRSRKIVNVKVRRQEYAPDRSGGGDDFAVLVAR